MAVGLFPYLDEDFDRAMLSYLEQGDVGRMAARFDDCVVPDGHESQFIGERGRQVTGMASFGGPQGRTREICNRIVAAAVCERSRNTIVDYVPVYAVGAAFAYRDDVL